MLRGGCSGPTPTTAAGPSAWEFAAWMFGDEPHDAGRHLWLEDRRHRHRVRLELVVVPVELRGVDTRELHLAHLDRAALGAQLGDDRLGESLDGVLRAAVR